MADLVDGAFILSDGMDPFIAILVAGTNDDQGSADFLASMRGMILEMIPDIPYTDEISEGDYEYYRLEDEDGI